MRSFQILRGTNDRHAAKSMRSIEDLSEKARAFHDELWEALWHGPGDVKLSDKRAELRAKYGDEAEVELIAWLKVNGWLA